MVRRPEKYPVHLHAGAALGAALVAIGAASAAAEPAGQRSASVPAGYNLVWSDEFDGQSLSTGDWVYRTTRRGNVSVCRPQNVTVSDGMLRIACRREPDQPVQLTCGGAITARKFLYGYYEVAVRLHGGDGWHEAFWTTFGTDFNLTPAQARVPRIEIDCFENYAEHGRHKFTYGIIEWHPVHGGLSRDYHETDVDLAASCNVFAFEYTPEFINFFFNGELLQTVDVRDVPHNPFNLWLSSIATQDTPDMQDGYCDFDYLRCYAIDPNSPEFRQRRERFLAKINRVTAPQVPSAGTNLWIQAEDFVQHGDWATQRDGLARILKAPGDRKRDVPRARRTARTMIDVPQPGTYHLWVCARDYATNQPGKRNFQVAVNGQVAARHFGTHGEEGYRWEDGGSFDLPAGLITLELIDSTRYFARCDRLLLTSDPDYRPQGLGAAPSVAQRWDESRDLPSQPASAK
ncbi:MAG TPA: glycoside hydrolase family 16 protein [Phycisphaerae bacterium]|nr:glycoside hydrolase family 16 protein [Phycisphaerae bacterium]